MVNKDEIIKFISLSLKTKLKNITKNYRIILFFYRKLLLDISSKKF